MLKNEKIKDVRIAFIFSATLKEDSRWHKLLRKDNWRIWEECIIKNSDGEWYYWEVKEGIRKTQKGKDKLSSALEDYILVENFFLSKQLFHVGRDYTIISRFTPPINIELTFPIKSKDGNTTKVKPTIIISYHKDIDVVTLILNTAFDEIGTDDLIYIKSLKWNSIGHYEKAPKLKVTINGKDLEEQYFCDIFKILFNEIFKGKLKIETETESPLDLIEIRDNEFGEQMFYGGHNDLLFGILVGDEGYMINSLKMMNKHISNPDIIMEYREYFKYFFAPTTILGLFSKDYPECKKKFSEVYANQYSNFEPLCKYINLVSDIANLSDGLALVGEVTLIRYAILKEIDLKIRDQFEEGKMSFKYLLRLKRKITTRIANIELLAKNVLWINLLSTTDEMFGYNSIKRNIQERLEYIDSLIRDKYNAKIQNRLFWLTIIIGVLTALMVFIMILQFVKT